MYTDSPTSLQYSSLTILKLYMQHGRNTTIPPLKQHKNQNKHTKPLTLRLTTYLTFHILKSPSRFIPPPPEPINPSDTYFIYSIYPIRDFSSTLQISSPIRMEDSQRCPTYYIILSQPTPSGNMNSTNPTLNSSFTPTLTIFIFMSNDTYKLACIP